MFHYNKTENRTYVQFSFQKKKKKIFFSAFQNEKSMNDSTEHRTENKNRATNR